MAAFLHNQPLAHTLEHRTPFEIFFEKKPNVEILRLYDSRVFTHIPEERRKSKRDKKANLGVLFGYFDLGYGVIVNNQVIVARHVDTVEENVTALSDDEGSQQESSSTLPEEDPAVEKKSEEKVDEPEGLNVRKSSRERRMPAKFDDCIVYVNYCSATVLHKSCMPLLSVVLSLICGRKRWIERSKV